MGRIWAVLLAALAMAATACGDSADDATDAAGTTVPVVATTSEGSADTTAGSAPDGGADEGAFPVTVGGATIEARPERIVSLSPTATEVLYAIGAGDQVQAVDDQSDHPADAPMTDLSGFDPNLEAIAAEDPDLVVISFDPGELATGLGEIGVPVLVQAPATNLDEAYAQIEQLGAATGHLGEAAQVVADLSTRIDEIVAGAPRPTEPIRVYHELDDTFYSATSGTFIGALYGLLGLENVADAADDGSGYPQLNPEYLIEADPQLIVITDEVGYGPDEVAARPGWDQITAVVEGNILQVDSDLASRWGPRVVEFLELVAERVSELQPAGG